MDYLSAIPFVVEDRQIFLPFLGVALQEHFDAEVKPAEKPHPSSQVLLLYFIYQNRGQIYTNDAFKALGFSAMTITRAARQLEMKGIFRMEKEGVQKLLLADLQDRRCLKKPSRFWRVRYAKLFILERMKLLLRCYYPVIRL